ncbi:MAG: tetratricopeptide repeat protein [Actinomycetales bacterium]|nr:tetratricopeptide repeat protein [Actinomycetales bacterium]
MPSTAQHQEEPTASDPLEWFAARLQRCRAQAGAPSLRALELRTEQLGHRYGRASIADKLNGRSRPDWEFVESFVRSCALHTGASVADLPRLDLQGWRRAHLRMLRELAALNSGQRRSGNAAAELRCTLPSDIPAFTGRADVLALVSSAADQLGTSGDATVTVHAIDGMPGIGKTALAIHLAHRLRDRFPDGQLFVDLHAHTPGQQPVDPSDALARLLVEDGMDPQALPDDLDGRSRAWRSRMAGRRLLLVLDNAAGSAQVAPLLPGGSECLVLVTSRRHLGDLPAHAVAIPLDVLPPDQARQMLLRLAPHTAATPDAVTELVDVCGYLPLAISLVARIAVKHPAWTLTDLVAETRSRVLRATAENRSVAAAFDLSYEHLPPEQQRVFRLLGLHPGPEIDTYAAAALTGLPVGDAADHLDALHGDHLLVERGYRRYGMHDLLRTYARDRVTAESETERTQALNRLLDHYQHTATLANARIARNVRPRPAGSPGPAPNDRNGPDLSDHLHALSWLRQERITLLACLAQADSPPRIVGLAAAVAELLRLDGPWSLAVELHTTAARVAAEIGDPLHQANALVDLGDVLRRTGDIPKAIGAFHAALDLYDELGNRLGRANTLDCLAIIQCSTGEVPAAITGLQEALDLHRELGDQLGEATALALLGDSRRMLGDYREAVDALREALFLYRDLGYLLGEATALTDLSVVQRMTGDHPAAERSLLQALDLSRSLGDRQGEATALDNLGIVRYEARDYPAARHRLLDALDLFLDLGSLLGQANVLSDLGVLARLTGDTADAVRSFHEALELYRELGDPGGEVSALNELGATYLAAGDLDSGSSCHRTALDLARQHGYPWVEAYALAGLGRCALAVGDTDSGTHQLRQALEIFQRLGATEASDVQAELDQQPRPDVVPLLPASTGNDPDVRC